MMRCPITYELLIEGEKTYSANGLRSIHPRLKQLSIVDMDQEQLRQEAAERSIRMSIQGVPAKLSAVLELKTSCLRIVDQGGHFILKPQHHQWKAVPENEALTMLLARMTGLDVPNSGLLYAKDQSLIYWIRRFDRPGSKSKVGVGDFVQLLEESRDTKYQSSVEKVVSVIDKYCSFPAVEKAIFFKRFLFNYLVGNEDMHLKNYSLIEDGKLTRLSPCYDLLNTSIVLNSHTESALPFAGNTRRLNRQDLFQDLGYERCGLNERAIGKIVNDLYRNWSDESRWKSLINASFLPEKQKDQYVALVEQRWQLLVGNA